MIFEDADNEKLTVTFDNSNDQQETFPNGYYIGVILKKHSGDWVNSGRVFHAATLAELEEKFKGKNAPKDRRR